MSRQATLWILVIIAIAGVALRSYELTARSLWFDEAFSWRLIQFSFPEMITRAAADVHPPLYYILLRGWTYVFGTSLVALRSLSVVFAAFTIFAGYGLAAYATRSRRAGLLAASLLAVSGWQIAFAWEARMYTLGTFLALMSTWLLLRGVRKPQVLPWLGYALVAVAFAYTHYFAFFTLAAHALFILGVLIKQTRGRVGEMLQSHLFWFASGAAVLAVALYSPWIPVFISQNAQVQDAYWVPAIGGWSIPDTFYRMVLPTAGIPSHTGFGIVLTVAPIILAVLLWLLLPVIRTHRNANVLLALCGAVPFLLAIAVSFIGQSLYQDRFLVFANIFIIIGIACVIEYMPRRWRAWLAGAAIVIFLGGFIRYWIELDIVNHPGAHAATEFLAQRREGDELVVVSSPFVYFAIDHYLQEQFNQPGVAKLYSETGEFSHFAGGPILRQEDFVGPEIFQSSQRTIWLVDSNGFGGSKLAVPESWQAGAYGEFDEVFEYQAQVFVTKYRR